MYPISLKKHLIELEKKNRQLQQSKKKLMKKQKQKTLYPSKSKQKTLYPNKPKHFLEKYFPFLLMSLLLFLIF
jgi:argininosuccinate lyase